MNDNAIIPTRASKESAGLDLYSSIDIDIEVGLIKKVNTGICTSLPENSYGSIRDKSSLASKGLLTLGGVIDKDYTGEIIVIMTSLIETIKIKKGQKIAQLIVSNIMYPEIKKVLKFTVGPVRDDKYIITKLKIFNRISRTTFTDNAIPIERNLYTCIPAIDIDSVLKIDNKRTYPQAYL